MGPSDGRRKKPSRKKASDFFSPRFHTCRPRIVWSLAMAAVRNVRCGAAAAAERMKEKERKRSFSSRKFRLLLRSKGERKSRNENERKKGRGRRRRKNSLSLSLFFSLKKLKRGTTCYKSKRGEGRAEIETRHQNWFVVVVVFFSFFGGGGGES